MQKTFRKVAISSLILVYLVIAAGAIVRMTGSGMGCPDWPKCFGYLVPPTNVETLQWQPNRAFKEGQVIIKEEALYIANLDFTSTSNYNPSNWNAYTKHDYATFNVWHTWIEYINRLLGALAGLATLILAVFSIRFWKNNKVLPILSWLVVFGMGFQAWLGATVVYSVLEPLKITLHMFMALVIVALLLYLIFQTEGTVNFKYEKRVLPLIAFAVILTLIQVFLGTQVRQFVDDQVDVVGYLNKSLWLNQPEIQFYIHRSLSILVLLLNGALFWTIKTNELGFSKIKWVMMLIGLEILTGILMFYFDFPFASQPLHLVLASILFGVQFYLFLEVFKSRKSLKSL
ncbi:COX15/CtaA family protein [Croceivirga thetidis]|uniref:Heme A synthase n=1 Tax=Croceivirga thetidis TaxID=2721623 RepID=A0ABX1GW19_9FLAO|nr:COX15/CtaA family protein [Croceivirga thetidis]NKI32922.1 heme A synthase [Croceivirga thetidis]